MGWREQIEELARKSEGYRGMLRGGAPQKRAILYAVRCLKDEAADHVQRELDADCDPPALARATALLGLLMAYLVNESPDFDAMTDDERAAVAVREIP